MKIIRSLSSLLSMLAALSLASLACAQQSEPRGGGREQRERDGRMWLIAGGATQAQEERAGGEEFVGAPPRHRRERMTREERLQLRRDIHAAGRDLYRQTHGLAH